MPIQEKPGKLYKRDADGNLCQLILSSTKEVPDYQGATALTNGTAGLVPAATTESQNKYLKGDGTWSGAKDDTLSGYAKPAEASAISESDTIEDAIGKLEKAIDGKQEMMTTISGAKIDEMFE